jgi:hypothetical protein
VYLLRESDHHPVETETVNVSSMGFYCRVPMPVIPGEQMDCTLIIPDHHSREHVLCLQSKVEVVRMETVGGSHYIGCRIAHYRVEILDRLDIPQAQPLTPAVV